ncbi:GDP-L-fucose synthase [Desulfobacula sp.]|uniref:GDP-L-fucose synthase family protein n=1 Tax=Desulfobacula sp. TaxID=2593537 RepID=UPI0026276FB9|nr:GDP-L-fucose synthase [Desulfobacula sp.]
MHPNDKIYVAGHRGLVGAALLRCLKENGYDHTITRTHGELDLENFQAVTAFFERERPDYVFLAAAKVGGILANKTYPADFIFRNLMIQNHVIHNCHVHGVKRMIFLGSSCIYPRLCRQPMQEIDLMTGALEPTNSAYALAKIAGIEMCWAYNRQHGTQFIPVMPTNLYGPHDNFDLDTSHVLPALIRKFHDANKRKDTSVTLWGTGQPKREFLYVDDMADACLHVMKTPESRLPADTSPLFNIGTGKDLTIRQLALLIKEIVGFKGDIVWDTTKPDGTPQKLLDVSRMAALGWQAATGLAEGIGKTYQWYVETVC